MAVARGGQVLAAAVFPGPRFVGYLGTGLEGLLKAAGGAQPAGVAVVVGPGSIMGGRAAVAWARGWARATGGPLRAVGSLEALAVAAGGGRPRGLWCAGRAVRGEVYLSRDGGPPAREDETAAAAAAATAGVVWAGWVPEALAASPGEATPLPISPPCLEAAWEVAQQAPDLALEALEPVILYPPPIQ